MILNPIPALPESLRSGTAVAVRGTALFLGIFTLLNLAASLSGGYDPNIWWIDLRALPLFLRRIFLLLLSGTLIAQALRTDYPKPVLLPARFVVAAAFLTTLTNSIVFYSLYLSGDIRTAVPVPLSLVASVALAAILRMMCRPFGRSGSTPASAFIRAGITGMVAVGCALVFPLMQILSFGYTDYRRPAEAAVVFGAYVSPDGHLSPVLDRRVRTGCELYREGYVKRIILSGGPGPGRWHETEAMRRSALAHGVPERAIDLDPMGLSTRETALNTGGQTEGPIIAVSNFYHLPRIKLAYAQHGLNVVTVPTEDPAFLYASPFQLARETAAFWYYYLEAFFR